ncbi:DUF5677 domain-containing protein [Anaerosporobacter faecicola]|uniref:DUF5677 domain-containing protein n=1 Tax=Anaerosporobacter faecicola TaxID=2718714 RepID=UPI00143C1C5D|nr:DUF5677 domain-containing protein [Anaerosporobacter faecicola]
MEHSKLSEHKFKKGKFTTPWNEILKDIGVDNSWCHNRLPEYLWIGLIFDHYGREEGLQKIYQILQCMKNVDYGRILTRFSHILKLSEKEQKILFRDILSIIPKKVLSPLTLIFTYSNYPVFATSFVEGSVEERKEVIITVLDKTMDHQSNCSTDIRFIIMYYLFIIGKLHMPKEQIDLLIKYPHLKHDDMEMRMIRPFIRSMEIGILSVEKVNNEYLNAFWERISEMTECELYYLEFSSDDIKTDIYMEQVHEVYLYLSNLLVKTSPLDNKMLVLLGIATYSYKRAKEVVEHTLFNSISGRSAVRVLVENYIMMKYLLKNEESHEDIWTQYQYYGIGLYKLIVARSRESEERNTNSHVNYQYLEALVNEYKMEEFIDMETSYFDKQGIREKAITVGEKDLYGLYYDYDSSYEHGLWGAIRESSLIKCKNPAHQYHCVPDIEDNQKLMNVWPDCKMMLNRTIQLLDEVYGIPKQLITEEIAIEK